MTTIPTLDRTVRSVRRSPLATRLARGVFWSVIGGIISRAVILLSSIVAARLLGKTAFGQFAIIQSTVGMFQVFAAFGLGVTATKYVAEYRTKDPARAGRIIAASEASACITGVLCALVLFLAASPLASRTLAAPQLAPLLRIGSLLLFFAALNAAQLGALSGFEAFKQTAWVNFGVALITAPLMVFATYAAGLHGAVWASAFSAALNWLANHIAVRWLARIHAVPIRFAGCWAERRILYRFSLPAVLAPAVTGPATWFANALLANQPNGYGELGVYNAILRIKQAPEALATTVLAPVLPVLSEKYGLRDARSYRKTLAAAFTASIIIIAPFALAFAALPQLCLMPYGRSFQGHTATVLWLMLHSVLMALFSPMSSVLASMERMWFGTVFNLAWAAVYVGLAWKLVPLYGAAGLAASFAITHLVTSAPCAVYVHFFEREFFASAPLISSAALILGLYAICVAAGISGIPAVGIVTALTAVVASCLIGSRVLTGSRRPAGE